MANDFVYSERGHAEAMKALEPLRLDDDERAFALEQAGNILQPTAMQFKMELAEGKKLRPMAVCAAITRALIYLTKQVKAAEEGKDRYHYAAEASDEADAMIAAKGLTEDEEEFVCDLSNESIDDIEREFMVRMQRGQKPIRALAIVGAFMAAQAHADDWERYGWLKKG